MIVVFLGPPAIGKGTQARRLARSRGFSVVSTGDKLREAIASGTEVGREANGYMDAGQLVPDEVVVRIVAEALQSGNGPGTILDGFPRTLVQAEALENLLGESSVLDGVLYFKAPTELLVHRASGRRICSNCQAIFHLEFQPTQVEGVCDDCGEPAIVQRHDDREEAVRQRLEEDRQKTSVLVDFYSERSLLAEIDATRDVASIASDVESWLGGLV